jgi:putative SOS response-associated peptidase YedK
VGALAAQGRRAAGNFIILTTDPNELLELVHNRLPVLLAPRE